jgi:PucR C-terminal helix-turn-helix domain
MIVAVATESLSGREIVADLVARIGRSDAAREILDELRVRIGIYDRLPPEVAENDVLEACSRNLRLWSRWLATGAPPSEDDLAFLRDAVRARAAEGVPLEDLLDAYRLGGRLGWQILRRHASRTEHEALLDAAELLMEYIDTVSRTVTEAYLGDGELLVSKDERRTRSLLNRIVDGGPLTSEELELSKRFGLPARTGYLPFALAFERGSAHRHAALAARLRTDGRGLAVTEGDRVFGLSRNRLTLDDLGEGPRVLLATGSETPRSSLAAAREELMLLIDHGRHAGLRGAISREDHVPELLLARSPRLARLIRGQILTPLRDEGHADLVHTLETFVACRFDRARTSAALHVHRNTLAYRLRRIEEITGLDLGSPRDLACVFLSLQVGDRRGDEGAPPVSAFPEY